MKNDFSGRETRFLVFFEKNRRDWHDTCMLVSGSGVNRSMTTKAANRHPAGARGGSHRASEVGALHLEGDSS